MGLDFAALRRWPDVEADNLFATDAADRLILDEADEAIRSAPPGTVVVIGDHYGALTLGAADLGARGIRTHQDALSGELALRANAERVGLVGHFASYGLDAELLSGARVVLLALPRGLDALDEIAEAIARHADAGAVVVAGGRVKHMTTAMNDVLLRHFAQLDVTRARSKARGLVVRRPRPAGRSVWPKRRHDDALDLDVVAHAAAFGGAAVDGGTRLLLDQLDAAVPEAGGAIDLGCGTGVIAVELARRRPGVTVIASDQSAAAVASASATAEINGVADRVRVIRDDALSSQPDGSSSLIVLNPPFHIGSTVHTGIALKLFTDAARVLAPGGELWAVWNSHLGYRPPLQRIVGPTRQIARDRTYTVTASVYRDRIRLP